MENSVRMHEIVGQSRLEQAAGKESTGKTQVQELPSKVCQEMHNEYQELQIHDHPTITRSDTSQNRNSSPRSAGNEEHKTHSEECFEIKDNIKKLRRCICTLSLLFALLLLITAAAVVLAVLGFNNNLNVRVANNPSAQQGSARISEESRLNDTLSTIINKNFNTLMTQLTVINQTLLLSMELTQEVVKNKTGALEAHLNESNQNISTVVDNLEVRIDERLNYLQTTSQSQLAMVDNSLRSMIADLETRLQSASYQNITSLRAMIATTNAHVTTLQSSQRTTDTNVARLQDRIANIVRNVSGLQANQLVQPGIYIHAVYILYEQTFEE